MSGEKRAPYCLMGTCFECLMEIDGIANRQACMTIVAEGMTSDSKANGRCRNERNRRSRCYRCGAGRPRRGPKPPTTASRSSCSTSSRRRADKSIGTSKISIRGHPRGTSVRITRKVAEIAGSLPRLDGGLPSRRHRLAGRCRRQPRLDRLAQLRGLRRVNASSLRGALERRAVPIRVGPCLGVSWAPERRRSC